MGISVLLVESNDDLRAVCTLVLSDAGYAVRSVRVAPEAIAAIAAERPDVTVLALGIPGGATPVVDALRDAGGGARSPLVLASGARDLHEHAEALGAVYVTKPFVPEQLLQAVARAVTGERPAVADSSAA